MSIQDGQKNPTTRFRLWILSDWFIEVDFRGYYLGRLGEGAFGAVLCLQDEAGSLVAWKVPKLLADTMAENYYIERLLDQESQVVWKVRNARPPAQVRWQSTATLLQARDEKRMGAYKGLRELEQAGEKAEVQHGSALFIQFRKDKAPRLCLVKRNGSGGLQVIPEGAKEDLTGIVDTELWRDIKHFTSFRFANPSFYATTLPNNTIPGRAAPQITPLAQSVGSLNLGNVWYTGLASIQWDWAERSLQQSIAEGKLNCWQIEAHCHLWRRILGAVVALHQRGHIHADIRPANIFCTAAGIDSNEYFLGDYGSFSSGDGPIGSGTPDSNDATVGPDVGRGRVSPFYAVERRSGMQRETADVAIVVKVSNEEYRVWLGWRSFALDFETGENPRPELVEHIKAFQPSSSPPTNPLSDSLLPGDRLRIRDQVFKIKVRAATGVPSALLSAGQLCICEGWYATVLYDKLAILDEIKPDEIGKPRIVPLSGFTELWQWSAAADIFSIGALVLYTVYSARRLSEILIVEGNRTSSSNKQDESSTVHNGSDKADPSSGTALTPSLTEGSPQLMAVVDSEFREIMAVLEGVPFFRMIWPDLDRLAIFVTRTARAIKDEKVRAKNIKLHDNFMNTLLARADDSSDATPDISPGNLVGGNNNLLGVVSTITQSVPNAKVLLRAFNENAVKFVLFMHFVLQCVHRKDHLHSGPTGAKPAEFSGAPFCESRIASVSSGVAEAAYNELENLVKDLSNQSLGDSRFQNLGPFPDYDTRSTAAVLDENRKLAAEKGQLAAEKEQLATKVATAEQEAEKLKEQCSKLDRQVDELSAYLPYKAKAEEMDKKASEYQLLLNNILKTSSNTTSKMMGSQDELYQAIKTAQEWMLR
jgi:serine/threonine protein kinase